MFRYVNDLCGKPVSTTDGGFGKIDDVYFGEKWWTIRYFVVETEKGDKVLVLPPLITNVDGGITLGLTEERLKNSPSIDWEQPITRQSEKELHAYYDVPIYWGGDNGFTEKSVGLGPEALEEALTTGHPERTDGQTRRSSHLQSAKSLIGYQFETQDEAIGYVKDFVFDDQEWKIRYVVLDAHQRVSEHDEIVLPCEWIEQVSWFDSKIYVDLPQSSIKSMPAAEWVAERTDEQENPKSHKRSTGGRDRLHL